MTNQFRDGAPVLEQVNGVAIVGAGLAGLTLAAGLYARRTPVAVLTAGTAGHDCAERGLCLWGGALAALTRIGLGATVWGRGAPIERLRLWSANGRPLLDLPTEDVPGLAGLAIRESALLAVLRDACAGVPMEMARRVLGYGEDGHGVLIDTDRGGPVRALVAVGADGPQSAMRRQCLDDGPPLYSGDSMFEGIGPAARWLSPGTLHLFWGREGARGGAVALPSEAGGPGAQGASAWWVDLETGPLGGAARRPDKRELEELLAEMSGPLRELVAATPEQAIRIDDVFARRQPRAEGNGRVTLIGDAAHALPAPLRLGPSLAIEDAVTLSEAVGVDSDLARAFRRYEQQRLPRIDWVSGTLWRLRAVEARFGGVAAWMRDTVVRQLPLTMVRELLSRLTAGSGAGAPPRAQAAVRALRTKSVHP